MSQKSGFTNTNLSESSNTTSTSALLFLQFSPMRRSFTYYYPRRLCSPLISFILPLNTDVLFVRSIFSKTFAGCSLCFSLWLAYSMSVLNTAPPPFLPLIPRKLVVAVWCKTLQFCLHGNVLPDYWWRNSVYCEQQRDLSRGDGLNLHLFQKTQILSVKVTYLYQLLITH